MKKISCIIQFMIFCLFITGCSDKSLTDTYDENMQLAGSHAVYIDEDGTLKGFGDSSLGQLGDIYDEYIENGVQRLRANLEEILNRQDRIELTELTLLGMDKVNAYISLLFLTVDSDYDLMQDEFYGDLYVVRYSKNENQELEKDEDNIFDAVNNVTSILKDEGVNSNGTIEI